MAIVVNLEQLLIFGGKTIELWYDAGAADFPFQRYDGATVERGLAAPLAFAKQDQAVFFLGDDLVVYRLQGYYPIKVSQPGIEHLIAEYAKAGSIGDAFMETYTIEGHKMVALTFPSVPGSSTLEFDISTNFWHERESRNASAVSYGRWRAGPILEIYSKILVGDAFSGQVGVLDWDVYTEYGLPIIGMATSPPLHADRKRVFMSLLELDCETGVGLITGQGSDPQVMLDWSDDGGRTWSQRQLWRSLGKVGQYLRRLRWLKMGWFRQRVLRVHISDPVKRTILSAHADLSVGM
jgi:hypothetical protein